MFKATGRKIPFEWAPIFKILGYVSLCLVGFFYKSKFPVTYLLEDEFTQQSFFYKFIYIYVCCICIRCMYYSGWLLTELSCLIAGLSYNGHTADGKIKWDRVTNIHPLEWELSQNFHDIIGHWNIGVIGWLKKYVYLRIRPGQKPTTFNRTATFAVSAFWHGFYPGYYLFFLSCPLFYQPCEKALRSSVRTFFLTEEGKQNYPLKYVYDVISFFFTQIGSHYLAVSFVLLTLEDGLYVWKQMYFFGHIVCALVLALDKFHLLPKKKIKIPPKKD